MTERRSRSAGCQWRMSKGSRHDRAAFKIHHIQFECYTCRWSSSLISLFDWNFESRILHIAQLSWRQKKKRDESKRPKQNCFMKYEIRCFMKGSWCRLHQVIIFFVRILFTKEEFLIKHPSSRERFWFKVSFKFFDTRTKNETQSDDGMKTSAGEEFLPENKTRHELKGIGTNIERRTRKIFQFRFFLVRTICSTNTLVCPVQCPKHCLLMSF